MHLYHENISSQLRTKINHYKIFKELPFLPEERESTTILLGGFTMKHDLLVRAAIEGLGYKVEHLPTPQIQAYHTGREFCNNGMCNPAYFTIGNLIQFLFHLVQKGMTKEEILKKYVFLTVGACGPCRFGMYENEYRLALRNAGFDGFRVLVFQQVSGFKQTDENSGLVMNEEFFLGIIKAILIADLLNDFFYKVKPYEINQGETDLVLNKLVKNIYNDLKNEQKILNSLLKKIKLNDYKLYFLIIRELLVNKYRRSLSIARNEMKKIQVDNLREVPIVKITGEFWAQTTEGDGNFKIFKYLLNEGCEVIIEPIMNWLLYLLFDANQYLTDRRKITYKNFPKKVSYYKNKILIKIAEDLINKEYNKFRKYFLDIPEKLSNQYILAEIANPYYNNHAKGGEGHLEVAKSIYYTKNFLAHMILSVKPFGCLPSTQSDGVHALVTAKYPEMIFLPIETSAEGEINAYSRVQMALSEAKQKCKTEIEYAYERTSLKKEKIKEFLFKHPEYMQAGFKIKRLPGVISRTANFIYYIKGIINK